MSVRLLELAQDRWDELHPMLSLLKETAAEQKQALPRSALASPLKMAKVVLVFFIGGITFAEIAAIRHLNRTSGKLDLQSLPFFLLFLIFLDSQKTCITLSLQPRP